MLSINKGICFLTLCGLTVLGGCSTAGSGFPLTSAFDNIGYSVVYPFQTHLGQGALRKNNINGKYDIKPGQNYAGVTIDGVTNITDAHSEIVSGRTILYIDAASQNCQTDHLLIVMEGQQSRTFRVGDCRATYRYEKQQNGDLLMTENGAADPTVWFYNASNGGVFGPVRKSALYIPTSQPQTGQRNNTAAPSAIRQATANAPQARQKDTTTDYHVAVPEAGGSGRNSDSIAVPAAMSKHNQGQAPVASWDVKTDSAQ